METAEPGLPGLGGEIFEVHPTPTVVVDGDVRLLLVNREARRMLGHAGDGSQLLLRRGGDVLHCLNAEGAGGCGRQPACSACVVRRSVTRAMETGSVQRGRADFPARRGSQVVDISLVLNAAPVDHGGDRRVVLTIEDVTDLAFLAGEVERLEREVRDSDARLRTALATRDVLEAELRSATSSPARR
jgi:hypothetical protein